MYARAIAQLTIGVDEHGRALHGVPEGIIGVIGWPDGMVMDSDQSTIDELSKVYGLRFVKADRNPMAKKGAIELVNGDLVDARILVIKNSPLEDQLIQLQWAEDQNGNVKENSAQANHSTDTLVHGRKLIATMFESGVVHAPEPKPGAGGGGSSAPPAAPESIPGIATSSEYEGLLTSPEFVDVWGNG